jgi:hypothetical protein
VPGVDRATTHEVANYLAKDGATLYSEMAVRSLDIRFRFSH